MFFDPPLSPPGYEKLGEGIGVFAYNLINKSLSFIINGRNSMANPGIPERGGGSKNESVGYGRHASTRGGAWGTASAALFVFHLIGMNIISTSHNDTVPKLTASSITFGLATMKKG